MSHLFVRLSLLFSLIFQLHLHADEPFLISPAGDFAFDQSFGSATTQEVTVTNPDPDEANDWQVVFENEPQGTIARVLDLLENRPGRLLADLPGRFFFSEGETGDRIEFGGNFMYNGGNRLQADGTTLAYANFLPANVSVGDGSLRYVTAKLDGLFVFAGDFEGINEFGIGGFLRNQDSSVVGADDFTLDVGGVTWRAFVRKVTTPRVEFHRFRNSSVLQLILVPDSPTLMRTFDESVQVDGHSVSGLPSSTPLHYLLFSRPAGGDYGPGTFRKVARNYLEEILPGPRWCRPDQLSGEADGGESVSFPLQIDSNGLAAGSHETRFAVVPEGLDPAALEDGSWKKVALEVAAVPFEVVGIPPLISALSDTPAEASELVLGSTGDGPLPENLSIESSVDWLTVQPLGEGRWQVGADTGGLSPALYLPELTISDGESVVRVTVPTYVETEDFQQLFADPVRPRLYALSRSFDNPGFVLAYDAATRELLKAIPVGRGPADFDFSADNEELLVLNGFDATISRVDLNSLAVSGVVPLPDFASSASPLAGRIVGGPGSSVIYLDQSDGPRLFVFDLDSGTVLQTIAADVVPRQNVEDPFGFGDLAISPDRTRLYGWAWSGDDVAFVSERLNRPIRYEVGPTGMLSNLLFSDALRFDFGYSAVLSAVGNRFTIGRYDIDLETLQPNEPRLTFPVDSMSPGGELLGANALISRPETEETFRVSSVRPHVFTPDYAFYVGIGDMEELVWNDLGEFVTPAGLGFAFTPTEGGGVIVPGQLTWPPVTNGRQYEIYLGTDAAGVRSATPDSPEFFGTVTGLSFDLPDDLTAGQTYHWRVSPLGVTAPEFEMVRSFEILNLGLSRRSIESTTVAGATRRVEKLQIDVAPDVSWTVSSEVPWLTSETESGSGSQEITLVLNAGELDPGLFEGTLVLSFGGVDVRVSVKANVEEAFVIANAPVPQNSEIWTVMTRTNETSFLVAYDTGQDALTKVTSLDFNPTLLAVHPRDNRIHLAERNSVSYQIYDPETLERVSTVALEGYTDELNFGEGLLNIQPGPAGRLVAEVKEEERAVLLLLNSATGGIVDEFSFGPVVSGNGVVAPDGEFYYHRNTNSNQAELVKFDLGDNQLAITGRTTSPAGSGFGASGPLIGATGDRLYFDEGLFDRDLNFLATFEGNSRSISPDGSIFVDSRDVFNARNGLLIERLPVNSARHAWEPSGETFYIFDRGVLVSNLAELAALPDEEVVGLPAEGDTLAGSNISLTWQPVAEAFSYDVYFGTDRDLVASAGRDDASFLGTVEGTEWREDLPGLALGGGFFWRIDQNGYADSRQGAVRQFRTAAFETTPNEVTIIAFQNQEIPEQVLGFNSDEVRNWTAVSSEPWIELQAVEGDTDGELRFTIDSSRLSRIQTYVGSITITAGEESFDLPVEVDITDLNIILFAPHPTRPLLYGVNGGLRMDHLFLIDGATGEILDGLRVGESISDLAIDPETNRLFVVDTRGESNLQVINLETFEMQEPLDLGSGVNRIDVDPGRRTLIAEGGSQATLYDLDTLERKTSISGRADDGKADPVNNVYYRAESRVRSDLVKYDLSTNPPTLLGRVEDGNSINRFLLSPDGEALLWRSRVYNPDLEIVNFLTDEPTSLSPGGELASGMQGVYWLDDGTRTFLFPEELAARQSVFTSDGDYLVIYDGNDDRLISYPIDEIAEIPGPTPHDGSISIETLPRLEWTPVEGAESYILTLRSPSLGELVFENLPTSSFDLALEPANGEFVTWQVRALIPGTSPVDLPTYRFGKRIPRRSTIVGDDAQSISMGPEHILTTVGGGEYELRSFDPLTGETRLLESNIAGTGRRSFSDFGNAVLDRASGTLAYPNSESDADHRGQVFQLDAAVYERAKVSELLPPPGTIRNFGRDLAVSGGLQLTGTLVDEDGQSQVIAYQTHPEIVQTQLFGSGDGGEFDGFGNSISLLGNLAAIATQGGGNFGQERPPAIFLVERNPGNGLWTIKQKLEIPEATPRESIASLQITEDFLAASDSRSDFVHLFNRNEDGLWSHQVTFGADEFPRSSDRFGDSLALVGNRVFIGDPESRFDGQRGAVYTLNFDGESWQQGVPVLPPDPSIRRDNYGKTLAARDGWLMVGANVPEPGAFTGTTGHLFQFDPDPNHTPVLPPTPMTEAVAGQFFEIAIEATDLDGPDGLVIEALQLPSWASLTDEGGGRATLSGNPTGFAGSSFDFQLRVTDPEGASSHELFRLTLIASAQVPFFTLEPDNAELREGQDLLLRSGAGGPSTLSWQWFHNDERITGANRPTLEIAEVTSDDAGEYRVEVSNIAGVAVSRTVPVTVAAAGRDAGPWSTFGNVPRRAGYHPAELRRHTFVPAWTAPVQPTRSISRAVIKDGRVALSGETNQGNAVYAFDLATGVEQWRRDFAGQGIPYPLSIHEDALYFQENDRANSKLWSLSAADGSTNWEGDWVSQSAFYEAPAVTDLGVWIGGGSGTGIYGFAPDGTPLFFQNIPGRSAARTPMVSGDRLFSWVEGILREHDPVTGQLLWSVTVPSGSNNFAGVIRGDRAYVESGTGIVAVDLARQEILWTSDIAGNFFKAPALAGDLLHVITFNGVLTFDAETGDPGPVFTLPVEQEITTSQPLLLTDHLIVSTADSTYIFDRETTEMVQEIGRGGEISYAEGYLVIANDLGRIDAFFANQAPGFDDDFPTVVNSGDAALPAQISLGDFATDADPGDALAWQLVSQSRPDLFESLAINSETGALSVIYNPYEWGESEVVVSVSDQAGNETETSMTFTVPEHAAPGLELNEEIVLNRLTGLYEHRISLTNLSARAIAGFDLTITGLPDGATVYNTAGEIDGGWSIENRSPLAAGAVSTLFLEYFTPLRGVALDPQIVAAIVREPENHPEVEPQGEAVEPPRMIEGGVLVEFPSTAGEVYEIQYSDDMATWKSSPTRIRAGGSRTQWIDRGPPRTETPPSSSRFYRLRQIPSESVGE